MSYSSVQDTLASLQRELSSIVTTLQQANHGVGEHELSEAVSNIQTTISNARKSIQQMK